MKRLPLSALALAVALAAAPATRADDAKPGSARAWVKDSIVTTQIKTQLAASKVSSLASVHVETDADGFVLLTGKVANAAEKERAGSIAKATPGVKSVDNQLTVAGK